MNNSSDLLGFSLIAAGFLVGSLAPVLGGYLTKLLNRRASTGPVVIKRKGTNELVTIPDHYDSEAVDTLLKKLKRPQEIPV